MSHVAVAVNTTNGASVCRAAMGKVFDHRFVAFDTVVLQYSAIFPGNRDRLTEICYAVLRGYAERFADTDKIRNYLGQSGR